MNILFLAWTMLKRDWYSGELRLMALALTIAVTSITSVTMFTDRAFSAVENQAAALLAGDLALESSTPLPPDFAQHAQNMQLRTAATLAFRSVISVDNKLQLAEVKAVDEHYPLRGHLETSTQLFMPGIVTEQGPAPGAAWADNNLFQLLQITPGHKIALGELELPVPQVLLLEPDRGGDMFSIAPRVLIRLEDVPATKLVLPGSRVTHKLLIAGEHKAIEAYQTWCKTRLTPTIKLLTVRDARLEVRDALERAHQFLGLAALTSLVLSGIAIASAARRFAARHLDSCAMMRCLGTKQNRVLAMFATELLLVYVLVSALSFVLALVTQDVLAHLLAGLVSGDLPAPSLAPIISGNVTGLALLLGFAMPPLLRLRNVPPMRVLRRDFTTVEQNGYWIYLLAVLTITALAPWQIGQPRMTLYVLLGSAVTMLALAVAAWVLVLLLGGLRNRVGVAWRYGLANITRRAASSIVQVVGLGLGLMVLLVLGLVRGDLLQGWLQNLPPNANNQFLVNVQPQEVPAVQAFFTEQNLPPPTLYPMVRGRLVAINQQPVVPDSYPNPKAKRLAERDFNLSWAMQMQLDNRITLGSWWSPANTDFHQFSVEKGIAETLDVHLGDQLTYQIAEQQVTAKVTSLREVNWDTFNVNFFVIAPPGLLETYPNTFITSFYLSADHKPLLNDLVRRFPSITVVDVAAIMDHVRGIMDRVAMAAEFVFLFTLAAGLLVLIAALQSTHDERLRESALLRSLGASNRTVAQGLLAEFVALGCIAGLLAAAAAMILGYVLAHAVFNVKYITNPWLLPLALAAGTVGVGTVGLLGTRRVRQTPPMTVLRRT